MSKKDNTHVIVIVCLIVALFVIMLALIVTIVTVLMCKNCRYKRGVISDMSTAIMDDPTGKIYMYA